MQLAPNQVIAGRFKLNRLLGRGGMGSVWLAMHLGLDVPCAVKFIEGDLAQNPEALARFEREAKAAAQLRSPHVVQILDHGVSDGTPYIAMELLEGEDLGKRLAKAGRLPPRDVVRIVSEVCRALSRAHAAHIVHRDLKPDNIFLVPDDDREIAKVLDFGIAKAGSALDSSTRTGALLGTPYYMSPEQAQGTKTVDTRADLWSLAVIVYECLTGSLPFQSEALGDLLVKIIMGDIPVPSQVAPGLPPQFDQWWARAASRDPQHRFQTAKEFETSLAMALGFSTGPRQERPALPPMRPSAPSIPQYPTPPPSPFGGTGAPVAHTFNGNLSVASTKKTPIGLIAAIGGGALSLVAVAALVVGVAIHKSDSKPIAPAAQPPAQVETPLPKVEEKVARPEQKAPEEKKAEPAPEEKKTEPADDSAAQKRAAANRNAAATAAAAKKKLEEKAAAEKKAAEAAAAKKKPTDFGF